MDDCFSLAVRDISPSALAAKVVYIKMQPLQRNSFSTRNQTNMNNKTGIVQDENMRDQETITEKKDGCDGEQIF